MVYDIEWLVLLDREYESPSQLLCICNRNAIRYQSIFDACCNIYLNGSCYLEVNMHWIQINMVFSKKTSAQCNQ